MFYTFIIFTRYPHHLLIERGHSSYCGTASSSCSVRVMHLKTGGYTLVQAPSVAGGMNVLACEGVGVFSNVWQNCSCFMSRTEKKNVGNWRVSCVESNSSLVSEVWV